MSNRTTRGHQIVDDARRLVASGRSPGGDGLALVAAYRARGFGDQRDEVSTLVEMLSDIGGSLRAQGDTFEDKLDASLLKAEPDPVVATLRSLLAHAAERQYPVEDIMQASRNSLRLEVGPERSIPAFQSATVL